MTFTGNPQNEQNAKLELCKFWAVRDLVHYTNSTEADLMNYHLNTFNELDRIYGSVADIQQYMIDADCDRVAEEIEITGLFAYCDESPMCNADVESENHKVETLYW